MRWISFLPWCLLFPRAASFNNHDLSWIDTFGRVRRSGVEEWGILTSIRVFYHCGVEAEDGFAGREWAAVPVDRGTYRVVADGMQILFDPGGLLARLEEEVTGKQCI